MTTSGSIDFSVGGDALINDVLIEIGVKVEGVTSPAEHVSRCRRALNMMIKSWQETFAEGEKLWLRRRCGIFLANGTNSYNLGSTGSHASMSYIDTILTAAGSTSDTTLNVVSGGMTAGDYIGIELDNDTLQWTTIATVPGGGATVTIGAPGLTSAAASGNKVFTYTTKTRRPEHILTMVMRDEDGNDLPMDEIDLYAYESIGDKDAAGIPSRYYYEPQLTNGVLYLDMAPNVVNRHIRAVFMSPFEDFDASDDTPDFPQFWYRALKFNLSLEVAGGFHKDLTETQKALAIVTLAEVRAAYPENSTVTFEPERPE